MQIHRHSRFIPSPVRGRNKPLFKYEQCTSLRDTNNSKLSATKNQLISYIKIIECPLIVVSCSGFLLKLLTLILVTL